MRKYLLHILIISFVFLLAPAAHVASYALQQKFTLRLSLVSTSLNPILTPITHDATILSVGGVAEMYGS